jgi:hypothetical protein
MLAAENQPLPRLDELQSQHHEMAGPSLPRQLLRAIHESAIP